jgi:hypothetical protein
LKHLPQTRRCPIGEQGEHDEQIRIVIGNSFAGISSSVCVNHLWPVVAGGGGMKDEALKLALKALDIVKIHFTQNRHVNEAITAIKQALAAQPAVPDALFRHAPEHPQYIEGWNDCRAEMLKGMKP